MLTTNRQTDLSHDGLGAHDADVLVQDTLSQRVRWDGQSADRYYTCSVMSGEVCGVTCVPHHQQNKQHGTTEHKQMHKLVTMQMQMQIQME